MLGILSRSNFLKGYARFTEVLDSRGEVAAAAAGGGDDDDDDGHTPIRSQPIYRGVCESLRKFDDRLRFRDIEGGLAFLVCSR